jgi:hypothetical protein
MKLNDFCTAVDAGKLRRAGFGCTNLVSKGIISRDVRVDSDGWEMVLDIAADNGWRYSVRWELYADCLELDPLHHATDEQLILMLGMGIGICDLESALMDAAPRLVATYTGGMDDDPPRNESERLHRINQAIRGIEEQIAAWYKPLAQIERDEDDVETLDPLNRVYFPGLAESLDSLSIRAS